MWCPRCQTEVAAEASTDNLRWFCTNCSTELTVRTAEPGSGFSAKGATDTSKLDPQALLARWSDDRLLDPLSPVPTASTDQQGESSSAERKTFRLDIPQPTPLSSVDPHIPLPRDHQPISQNTSLAHASLPAHHRADASTGLAGPHFAVPQPQAPQKAKRALAVTGQVLAYTGAAALTGGAALVMIGYLGGPSSYAPSGWFTTMLGQLLLFLGVITLVAAGMEQTSEEVSRRVDSLHEQLGRLETLGQQTRSSQETEDQLRREIIELRKQLAEKKR